MGSKWFGGGFWLLAPLSVPHCHFLRCGPSSSDLGYSKSLLLASAGKFISSMTLQSDDNQYLQWETHLSCHKRQNLYCNWLILFRLILENLLRIRNSYILQFNWGESQSVSKLWIRTQGTVLHNIISSQLSHLPQTIQIFWGKK